MVFYIPDVLLARKLSTYLKFSNTACNKTLFVEVLFRKHVQNVIPNVNGSNNTIWYMMLLTISALTPVYFIIFATACVVSMTREFTSRSVIFIVNKCHHNMS